MTKRKTILVVDDTKENVEILTELLSDNYDVMVALNAKTGLEIVKEDKPDLLLLDIMMPEMDGYEMCKIIKKDDNIKHIPIIFITARTDEQSIQKSYDVGGVDYISKPFKPKELLARVSTQLQMLDLVCNLEKMVNFETNKRVEQEKLLMHQSRLAAIGEMMDVVAHQWTQPLSVMNSQIALLGIDVKFKKIDEEYIDKLQNKFTIQMKHMTTTLREFRNFFRPSKSSVYFDAVSMIDKALHLIEDELHSCSIHIEVQKSEDILFFGIENEFIHIVLNILNNAKDAFLENKIKDKKIVILLEHNDAYNSITITDNAGGIPEEIIDDIFKMNISSKSDVKGSGIGLYISLLIAEKHKGTLNACNVKSGANFVLKQAVVITEKS